MWGRTVGVMDTVAEKLFAELWLLDTFSKTLENKNSTIRKVWKNLDGTRSMQYARAISLPGGFQDRYEAKRSEATSWEYDNFGNNSFVLVSVNVDAVFAATPF